MGQNSRGRRRFLMLHFSKSATVLSVIPEKAVHSTKSTPELSDVKSIFKNSTTSIANDPSYVTSWSTDDTLSMITTPWTTESWAESQSSCEDDSSWSDCIMSSTLGPRSSTSYGVSSVFNSFSRTTLTIYSFDDVGSDRSDSIHPLKKGGSELSSTLSSWTVESFTSTGWLSGLSSNFIRVNYPWSPFTELSYTDTYPSSVASSRLSVPSSTKETADIVSLLDVNSEDHRILVS